MKYRQGERQHIHHYVEGHIKARKEIPSGQGSGVNQDPHNGQHSTYFYLNSWRYTEYCLRFRKV